jgi:hypothetical protein
MGSVEPTETLARLADRLAVSDLLTHYSHCIDTGQAGLLASEVFAAEVDVDLGWGRETDGAAAARRIEQTLGHFSGTLHALSNRRIEIAGDEASSTCCVQAYHWLLANDVGDPMRPADVVFTGMYEDRHRRTPAGWRIVRRRFRRLGVSSVGAGAVPDFLRPGRERESG